MFSIFCFLFFLTTVRAQCGDDWVKNQQLEFVKVILFEGKLLYLTVKCGSGFLYKQYGNIKLAVHRLVPNLRHVDSMEMRTRITEALDHHILMETEFDYKREEEQKELLKTRQHNLQRAQELFRFKQLYPELKVDDIVVGSTPLHFTSYTRNGMMWLQKPSLEELGIVPERFEGTIVQTNVDGSTVEIQCGSKLKT